MKRETPKYKSPIGVFLDEMKKSEPSPPNPSIDEAASATNLILKHFHGFTLKQWNTDLRHKFPYCEVEAIVEDALSALRDAYELIPDGTNSDKLPNIKRLLNGSSYQSLQQPREKSLSECKDEVARKYGHEDWEDATDLGGTGLNEIINDLCDLYASSHASEQGWVSIHDRMPEENQVVDIWKMWQDGDWGRQINVVYKNEHICEFSHWMPAVSKPTANN